MHDFEQFVRTRSAALARIAFLLTGDVHSAEDLLQDTLARVAERWRTLRGDDPEPYVRRMLYTGAVDNWRRLRRRLTVTQRAEAQLPQPAGDDATVIARRIVLADALAKLTPRQRAVLVLRYYEDRTETDTAALLGCSVNTATMQLSSRIRPRLSHSHRVQNSACDFRRGADAGRHGEAVEQGPVRRGGSQHSDRVSTDVTK